MSWSYASRRESSYSVVACIVVFVVSALHCECCVVFIACCLIVWLLACLEYLGLGDCCC